MASPQRTQTPPGVTRPFWRTSGFAALVIAGAALLAYHNSFHVPFVFDDDLVVFQNPSIHSLRDSLLPPPSIARGGLPVSGRPVVNFTFALNYALSGTDVWSYHVFNLLVHVLCGTLLFAIVRRTLLTPVLAKRFGAHAFELALVVAGLWTLHPLQTESVTYISQRAESLVGLMYLLVVWCYLRAAEGRARSAWSIGAVIACFLGMATKEVIVSAPIFVALYDRTFLAGSWREVWWQRRKLLLALAGTWSLLAAIMLEAGGTRGASAGFGLGVSSWQYLLTQTQAIVLYLRLSCWPHPLVLDYGTGLVRSFAEVWWQSLVVLGLFLATLWALVRKPVLGCVGAWFFLILAPSSSVVPVISQTMAEHRMYLPLAAVLVLVVTSAHRLFGRRAIFLCGVVALPLGATTVLRNEDYATPIRIFEDALAKHPRNARAMALLADYHRRAGHLTEARDWLQRSLEQEPGVVPVLNNLGNVLQQLGEIDQAIARYRQALILQPADLDTLNNLATALIQSGKTDEGIASLEAALRVAPASIPTRANLASALARAGRMREAVEQFALLARAVPDDPTAHQNYSDALMADGRRDEAIAELEITIRLRPDDPDLRNRLGTALGRAGRVREALAQFQEALRLNPNHESARANAARAERMLTH